MNLWKSILAGQLRTAIAVVAGSLVASGALSKADSDKAVEIAVGIVLWLLTAAWSAANKRWFHINLGGN